MHQESTTGRFVEVVHAIDGHQLAVMLQAAHQVAGLEVTAIYSGTDEVSVRTAGDVYVDFAQRDDVYFLGSAAAGRVDERKYAGERTQVEDTLRNGGAILQLAFSDDISHGGVEAFYRAVLEVDREGFAAGDQRLFGLEVE